MWSLYICYFLRSMFFISCTLKSVSMLSKHSLNLVLRCFFKNVLTSCWHRLHITCRALHHLKVGYQEYLGTEIIHIWVVKDSKLDLLSDLYKSICLPYIHMYSDTTKWLFKCKHYTVEPGVAAWIKRTVVHVD